MRDSRPSQPNPEALPSPAVTSRAMTSQDIVTDPRLDLELVVCRMWEGLEWIPALHDHIVNTAGAGHKFHFTVYNKGV